MRTAKRWLLIVALVVGASLRPAPAAAHAAGKMQVAAAPAGRYWVTVWTSPEPARVGEIHVSVALAYAADNRPALDESVIIRLTPPPGGGAVLVQTATTAESANKFLYESDFAVGEAGLYAVSVRVAGGDGEGGEVGFELAVGRAAGPGWPLLLILALALSAVGWYLWPRLRRPERRGG